MTMDIPHELVDQFARGNGVIFVGAGLSQGAGLPGWGELLAPLADSISLPLHLRADPLKIAQHYENTRGRQALVSHVIKQTDTSGKGPTDNHRCLLRLGVRTWVTTNYDDLIEQALREAGERFTQVVRDQDLPYISADTATLVKLHGDRDQPDTIVVTQQDYNTFFRRFPRINDRFTRLLLEKTRKQEITRRS
jgi:NAD-dependent SIR2 family protein deacetylase